MGLGKTIQTIYLMKEIIKEDETSKFLIVCPTALVYNWEDELNKYGKNLSYKIIHGTNRNKNIDTIKENILITSYGTLREYKRIYNNLTNHVARMGYEISCGRWLPDDLVVMNNLEKRAEHYAEKIRQLKVLLEKARHPEKEYRHARI